MPRDLGKDSRYCGTCEFWGGQREFNQGGACGDGVVRVISASGQCYRNKYNVDNGGSCKDWSRWGRSG